MHKKPSSVPRLPISFFRWFCKPSLRDTIEGDLIELYKVRAKKKGKLNADLKLTLEILLLLRKGIVRPMKGYEPVNNISMYKSYFTIGWRTLLKNKGYSIINIGGLAIGMAVAMLIGLWVYDELSYDKQNKNYDRVAQVLQNVSGNGDVSTWWGQPYPLSEELRTKYGSDFKHIAMAVQWGDHMLNYNDNVIKKTGFYIEKDGTEIIDIDIKQGTRDMNDPASILLSASAATSIFGTEDALEKLIKIDNNPLVKVVGVYNDFPHNSSFANLDFIAPNDFIYANDQSLRTMDEPWRPNFTSVFVELNDNNVDFKGLSEKIKDAKLKNLKGNLASQKPALFLHPMKDWHLRSEFKNGVHAGGAIQYVWIFGLIGVFVLLLACINFMNLSTARYENRAKEVGIRKAIGSVKSQLIFQFLSESFLTVLCSFALSLVITQLAIPFFNTLANKQVEVVWTSPLFWLIGLSFIIVTSLVAGSYPAFYLSSFKVINVLKGKFKAGRFARIPRQVLVTVQFTVSITLIIGTVIIYQQIQYAAGRPVGYSRESVVSIQTRNETIHNHFEAVKNELLQTRAVEAVAEAGNSTTYISYTTSGLSWPGKDPNLFLDFGASTATPEFGQVVNWKIKEGRDFSKAFASDTSGLILNQAAIDYMQLKNPIGQQVSWFDQPYTIIGVVENLVMESPYQPIRPTIYAYLTEQGNVLVAKLNPARSAHESLADIERVIKKYNPTHPFEYQFADEEYARKFGNEENIGRLVSVFATLAIFISCLGLFGLASFVAEQRTKEIGVRKVLGASVYNLWKMLSRDFVVLVIISLVIATPLAYYFMQGWLIRYTYHTEINWLVFASSGLGALVITLLTVSFQTIKAATANPVDSLRSE